MIAPGGLTRRAQRIRRAVVAELEARGAMSPTKEPAVARYARTLDAAWRAWEALPEGTVAGRTDRGGDRVHPCLEAAIKAEQAAVAFGVALGLEPDARRPRVASSESRMQPTVART